MIRKTSSTVGMVLFAFITSQPASRGADNDVGAPGMSALDVSTEGSDVGQLLGNTYKDEDSAFIIAPPAGSRLIRRQGLDLLTYIHDEKQWGGNVQEVNVNGNMTIDEYLRTSASELGKTFAGVQTIKKDLLKIGGRDAGRLALTMQKSVVEQNRPITVALYQQQLVVQVKSNQFFVVRLYSPLKDLEAATKTFDAMINSLTLLNKEEVTLRRVTAAKLGKEWLAKRSPEELKTKLLPNQLFRVKVGGADVGYITFVEQSFDDPRNDKGRKDGLLGVQVAVASRTFPPNGQTQMTQSVTFWAYSIDPKGSKRPDYSEWENASKVVSRGPVSPANPKGVYENWRRDFGQLQVVGASHFTPEELAQLKKQREELIRQNPSKPVPPEIADNDPTYHLKISITGDATQDLKMEANQGIDTDIPKNIPAALPKILEYTWPRLVDLTKPADMSFCVYNAESRKLTLRTLIVAGKDVVWIDKKRIDCYRCSDEMDGASTTMWVDAAGKVLMMRTSDQTLLLPTTEERMATLWAARLKGQ